MTRKAMYSALFIVAFLCSSLGSVVYVESAAAGPSVPCDVKWNNNKNQVKDKHRRKYIGCLIVALHEKTTPAGATKSLAEYISDLSGGCITYGEAKMRRLVNRASEYVAANAFIYFISDYVADKNRRSVIACLEGNL